MRMRSLRSDAWQTAGRHDAPTWSEHAFKVELPDNSASFIIDRGFIYFYDDQRGWMRTHPDWKV